MSFRENPPYVIDFYLWSLLVLRSREKEISRKLVWPPLFDGSNRETPLADAFSRTLLALECVTKNLVQGVFDSFSSHFLKPPESLERRPKFPEKSPLLNDW